MSQAVLHLNVSSVLFKVGVAGRLQITVEAQSCLLPLQSLNKVLSSLDLAIVSKNEPLEAVPQFVLGSVSAHRVKIVLHFVDTIADQIQHGLDL